MKKQDISSWIRKSKRIYNLKQYIETEATRRVIWSVSQSTKEYQTKMTRVQQKNKKKTALTNVNVNLSSLPAVRKVRLIAIRDTGKAR